MDKALPEKRPQLLVLSSTYPRWLGDHEPGFVHELAKRLTHAFDVTVLSPSAVDAATEEVMDGVRVLRFRYAPRSWETLVHDGGMTANLRRQRWKYLLVPLFLGGMLVALRRILRVVRPDVVHAHWLLPQGAIAVLASRGKVPLLATSHGADLYAWKAPLFERIKRYVIRNADWATVVSKPMAGELLRLGADPGRVAVAPMGVDLGSRFTLDASATRSEAEILFVGRLVEKKGLRHLIDAMSAIRDGFPGATLTVVGFGPELDERIAQVHRLGLSDAVRFVGAVPQAQLPDIYRRAAVFVAPFVESADGDREGLGLVSVEAAGCGCPVVVSDLPMVHDVFADGEAAFARPGDPQDIAARVLSVLRGESRPTAGVAAALAERFDWNFVAARYRSILMQAILQRRRAG